MKIKEGYKIKKMAGENVIITQGRYGMDMTKVITFNDTAEWLFNQVCGIEFTRDDIARLLSDRFDVDAETSNSEAKKFVETLELTGICLPLTGE